MSLCCLEIIIEEAVRRASAFEISYGKKDWTPHEYLLVDTGYHSGF